MKISILVASVGLAIGALAQAGSSLKTEMTSLHVDTVLLIPSQGIDGFAVWSPDSRYLAANVGGKWYKVDLSNVHFEEGKWHGRRIGVVVRKARIEPIAEAKETKHGESAVIAKSGLKAEIRRERMSSSFILTRRSQSTVVWKTDMENCGAVSLSPDEQYLAYICETNGIFVTDLSSKTQSFQGRQ
jgi:hypothetical protein